MVFTIVDRMLTELNLEEYREQFHNGHMDDEAMAAVITDQSFQRMLMDLVQSPGNVIRVISAFKRLSGAILGVGSSSNGGESGASSPAPAFSPIQAPTTAPIPTSAPAPSPAQSPARASTSGTVPTTAPAPIVAPTTAPSTSTAPATAPAPIVTPTQAPASPPEDDSDAAESEAGSNTSNVSQEEAKAIAHRRPSPKGPKENLHGG